MKKPKHPYTWPHKSRAAMTQYLVDHESYGGSNHPLRRWSPLSWDVKIHTTGNLGRKGEYKVNPELDDAFERHLNDTPDLWNWIVEDMQSTYTGGEYCTYIPMPTTAALVRRRLLGIPPPESDQGDWTFCFAGRQSGHMLLSEWRISPSYASSKNLLKDFTDEDDWRDWLEGLEFGLLKTLYSAVRCMDHDFRREAIDAEFEYHLNLRRHDWEKEKEYKPEDDLEVANEINNEQV